MKKFAYDVRNVCSIREIIETSADEFSSNPAFLVKDDEGNIVQITYARFFEEIKALSTYLCAKGLEYKKIAVIGKNSYLWALSYMAVVCGTGVVVPIDKELKAPEVKNILELSGADAVIYAKEMSEKIDACDFDGFKLCKTEIAEALSEGKKLSIYRFSGYWRDVGTVQSYYDSQMDLMDNVESINVFSGHKRVFSNSNVYPPQYIGREANIKNSLICNGCTVYGSVNHSILGSGAVVGYGTVIQDSIVLPNAKIGRNCHINRAIINEGAVVDDNTDIGSPDGDIVVFGKAKLSI
jgi:hypothetical protein